jgi:DNA-directed RNA polymerase specialized sigma subunit
MAKYIDNKRFEFLISEYVKGTKNNEEELMEMFYVLIDRIMIGFNFKLEKDNAAQDCMLLIIKALVMFDPDRGQAFNFFSTLIINQLKRIFTKDKKYAQNLDGFVQFKKYTSLDT